MNDLWLDLASVLSLPLARLSLFGPACGAELPLRLVEGLQGRSADSRDLRFVPAAL